MPSVEVTARYHASGHGLVWFVQEFSRLDEGVQVERQIGRLHWTLTGISSSWLMRPDVLGGYLIL